MKKIYYLGTCDTCKKIMVDAGINTTTGFEMQDIKTNKITAAQLEEMKQFSGSYESLFSRRAIKYKELGLKDKLLVEQDYRDYILNEYTFSKRPVVIIGKRIFVGSEKKTVEAMIAALKK